MLPSDNFITKVGSSAPRLRSISSRDTPPSNGGRAISAGQGPCHKGGADVIGDVGFEQRRGEAQCRHIPPARRWTHDRTEKAAGLSGRVRAGSALKGASIVPGL